MKAREIKIGDKFGDYEVISEPYFEGKYKKVDCRCTCGKIKKAYCGNVKRLTRCKKCSNNKARKFKIKEKINNFTILEYKYDKDQDRSTYLVQCNCGSNPYYMSSNELNKTKNCKSCFSPIGNKHPAYKGTKNISKTYYSQVLLNANIRNLEFNISINDMEDRYLYQNGKCQLSKLPIIIGNNQTNSTASLDRIDSSKGYTINNIQWVHKDVNKMKSDFDQKYFLDLCILISSNNSYFHQDYGKQELGK